MNTRLLVTALALTLAAALPLPQLIAQTATAPSKTFGGPSVGDIAPDFTIRGVTRYGPLADSTKLSALRGQTVVLAFFPSARTPGCTIQMQKYRDSYSEIFKNGDKVVVIGISADADTTLASWARDEHFPMLFASDTRGTIGSPYGAFDPTHKLNHRLLYVIGPDGKVAYVAKPFNVSSKDSYNELAAAVAKLQK